jgi:hypothetical protein
MASFYMVMRANGRRPKVRHATPQEAQAEAQRIAANSPAPMSGCYISRDIVQSIFCE